MMECTLTRLQAALLGCLLAADSCLLSLVTNSPQSQERALDLPEVLGTWELLEQGQLDESELTMLQAHDHWQRVYRCQQTSQLVIATLVAGASGPLVCHQPEVCYARNEFSSYTETQLWSAPRSEDQFRFQTFEPRDLERPAMTICYAWHDGDRWRAPGIPRLRLAGRSSLQRLQVSMRHPTGSAPDAQQALQQFLMAAVDATHPMQARLAVIPNPSEGSRRPQ
jgi:hypothetical protein